MNIVITGSLGHISKPLAADMIAKGHAVTVISTKKEKQAAIERMGARAAIGSVGDTGFLMTAFAGADIVYLMEPPFNFFDHAIDMQASWLHIAECYVQAILQSGVKRIIHLSSIGAHTDKGVGMLAAHHLVENILQELPDAVSIKTMRPVGFYYNMFSFIPAIRAHGSIASNYSAAYKEPVVSHFDIAEVVAREMELPFEGRTIRYIASDEVTTDELVKTLGEAIEEPALRWEVIPDEERLNRLINIGMNPVVAKGLVEMDAGRRDGILYHDYFRHRPVLGKVKLADFAKEFAAVYNNSKDK